MKSTTVKSYWANIYIGLRHPVTGHQYQTKEVQHICRKYVDEVGLCVSMTTNSFVYTDGWEDGVVVGLINYPRFPSTPEEIRKHAIAIAERCIEQLGQNRITIVMPDESVMVEREGPPEKG